MLMRCNEGFELVGSYQCNDNEWVGSPRCEPSRICEKSINRPPSKSNRTSNKSIGDPLSDSNVTSWIARSCSESKEIFTVIAKSSKIYPISILLFVIIC
ncbi:hypothetical protein MHBO_002108 [Bonamia ostreae]|uniref:Sushi domain-containing protein n=1 Tax=Bonamia ostreae TaxID=126728 RepID=A0ABV2ALS7_9EUKA